MLSHKQLKAAQRALQHYQAIHETLTTAHLIQYATYLEEPWKALVFAVTTTLRDNPELGSMVVLTPEKSERENANLSTCDTLT